jgi:glucose dehydrogenase
MVVVKGGIVFHAGGDGKFRAYDEDTGKVLWTGSFTGSSSGVPVGWESKGRQYVGVVTSAGGGRGGGGGGGARGGAPAPPADPNAPTGLIAYALPKK